MAVRQLCGRVATGVVRLRDLEADTERGRAGVRQLFVSSQRWLGKFG